MSRGRVFVPPYKRRTYEVHVVESPGSVDPSGPIRYETDWWLLDVTDPATPQLPAIGSVFGRTKEEAMARAHALAAHDHARTKFIGREDE